ncbi:MAG: radical SAM protein [Deltaproteobacteria bacterium]|nr:radical SAM protein [Deltaproteobacteria bacterium]
MTARPDESKAPASRGEKPPRKQDRDETPYRLTRSVCPECLQVVDARIVNRSGRLVMRKWCEQHGWFEALISDDAALHHERRRFNKPGTIPHHFEREFHGCPESCGLCPEHQQHTCLGIIAVTEECNLRCPVCFADARKRGRHLTLDQIGAMMDRLVMCEGDPEVLQISGGEPTLHPQIVDILAMARDRGFGKIMLNTNGIRLTEDPAFVDELARLDVTTYLQFDGFEPETYRKLRGRDLSGMKREAVRLLAGRGMRTVLVATLVRGVNEHELGALVDFALDEEFVRCLNIQPATFAGRFGKPLDDDPMDRVTLDEVVKRIAEQSRYGLEKTDFFPVPCPDPSCSLVTYIHKQGDEVRPIPRLVDIEDYLDYIKNASVVQLTDRIKEALEGLFSMSAVPGEDTTRSFCVSCGIDVDWGELEREITMISMMHFMDAHNFDLARLQKCCVHEVLPDDGGIVPFCANNVLRRPAR